MNRCIIWELQYLVYIRVLYLKDDMICAKIKQQIRNSQQQMVSSAQRIKQILSKPMPLQFFRSSLPATRNHYSFSISQSQQFLYQDNLVNDSQQTINSQQHNIFNLKIGEVDFQELSEYYNYIQSKQAQYIVNSALFFKRQHNQQLKSINQRKENITFRYQSLIRDLQHMKINKAIFVKSNRYAVQNPKHSQYQYCLSNSQTNNTIKLKFLSSDYHKLLPKIYLNDTLILNYLQIIHGLILPSSTSTKTFIFSTYLIEKLLKSIIGTENMNYDFFGDSIAKIAVHNVESNYNHVRRWTRKEDLFSNRFLVFPINMFQHWFGILVLNPRSLISKEKEQCQILFCDSMFEKRKFVVEAIRKQLFLYARYLQLQIKDKKGLQVKVTPQNCPDYQLLLPRQTNTHDCGIYLLAYIEELLLHHQQHFHDVFKIKNRLKLESFPHNYLQTLRPRILQLLIQLYQQQSPQKTKQVIEKYLRQRQSIFKTGKKSCQTINQKEYSKYLSLAGFDCSPSFQSLDRVLNELKYESLMRYYLSPDINYYDAEEEEQFQIQTIDNE